jgi:hypothetical protein
VLWTTCAGRKDPGGNKRLGPHLKLLIWAAWAGDEMARETLREYGRRGVTKIGASCATMLYMLQGGAATACFCRLVWSVLLKPKLQEVTCSKPGVAGAAAWKATCKAQGIDPWKIGQYCRQWLPDVLCIVLLTLLGSG